MWKRCRPLARREQGGGEGAAGLQRLKRELGRVGRAGLVLGGGGGACAAAGTFEREQAEVPHAEGGMEAGRKWLFSDGSSFLCGVKWGVRDWGAGAR